MKNLKKWSLLLLVAVFGTLFAACSDDDDKNAGSNSSIVGTWQCYEENDSYSSTETYSFKKDGTFTYSYSEKEYSTGEEENATCKGSYEYNSEKNQLKLHFTYVPEDFDDVEVGETVIFTVYLTADQLIIDDEGETDTFKPIGK